jgi:hypothetical protein
MPLHSQGFQKALSLPILEKMQSNSSVPERQEKTSRLFFPSIFGNWKVRPTDFVVAEFGALEEDREKVYTDWEDESFSTCRWSQYHPRIKLVLKSCFLLKLWEKGRVLNGDFIPACSNAILASNQTNI